MPDTSLLSFYAAHRSDAAAAPTAPPLRVGLLLPGTTVSRASGKVIEDILASDAARIPLVVVDSEGGSDPHPRSEGSSIAQRVRAVLAGLGWAAYQRLDRRRVRLADDPLAKRDVAPLLEGIPRVTVPAPAPGRQQAPPGDVIARIHDAALDVLVRLTPAGPSLWADPRPDLGLDGSLRDTARYGVWAFRYGDRERRHDGPACFWEMVEGDAVTSVHLERLPGGGSDGLVLAHIAAPTDPTSLVRNRVQPLYGSSHLVVAKLEQLRALGWDSVAAAGAPAPAGQDWGPSGRPGTFALLRWLGPRLIRALAGRIQASILGRTWSWQWRTAIRVAPRLGPVDRFADMTGFRWISPPRDHVYADPFLLARDGRTWLFVEDLWSRRGRGVITAAEVTSDGRLGPPTVVLESPGHLSYPHVFLDGETAYMIPESADQEVVRLYRATSFPGGWVPDAELFHRAALDTTVWSQDDRWWFFTSVREPRGGALVLLLFSADTLRGPWTSHPRNPISMDVRKARGAGPIFRDGGRVVRPSQDGSRTYGHSFTFQEIVILTPEDYEERPILTVAPRWFPGLHGTHTYSHAGSIDATDGKFPVTLGRRDG